MAWFNSTSTDSRNKIRNSSNYLDRAKSSFETKNINIHIKKFIQEKLEKLEKDINILKIKNSNDQNREILARLHDDIEKNEIPELDIKKNFNKHIISNTLDLMGIKKINKISWFGNDIATEKLIGLKKSLNENLNYKFENIFHTTVNYNIMPHDNTDKIFEQLSKNSENKKNYKPIIKTKELTMKEEIKENKVYKQNNPIIKNKTKKLTLEEEIKESKVYKQNNPIIKNKTKELTLEEEIKENKVYK